MLAPLGRFDILVNSAGADQHAFFTDSAPSDWMRLIAINLLSVLNATHIVLPAMQRAGYGRIVNVASEAGRLGSRGGSVYAAAKGGVITFTRSLARENGRWASPPMQSRPARSTRRCFGARSRRAATRLRRL
jgi:2-hydroxycyclohexanecarboxyl-CoA dehydrogenase